MIALHEAAVAIDDAVIINEPVDPMRTSFDINRPISSESYAALRTPYNKPLRLLPFDSNVVSVRRKRSATTLRRL